MNEIDKMPCVVCGIDSNLMCQRCSEPYCNDVCQRQDWQKHKLICKIMPPLVGLKALQPTTSVRHEAVSTHVAAMPLEIQRSPEVDIDSIKDLSLSSSNNNKKEVSGVAKAAQLSTLWKEHAVPPEKEFFECSVTCMEKTKDLAIWVMDVANTERVQRLTENISRSLQNKKPCSMQDLNVGDFVGVAVDNKLYRGEVIALNAQSCTADVRLIDYGTVVSSVEQNIYAPVQHMAEFKAYAFQVKLPTNSGVQINQNLMLQLLGSKTADGIEQAQLKPKMAIPLNLPVKMLVNNPEVSVARILAHDVELKEPQTALLQMKLFADLNDDLNVHLAGKDKAGHIFTAPFPEEPRTFFMAAQTKQGYRRAFLLDFIEQLQLFLVYEMDEGRISLTKEVRRIPNELLGHSMRVFAVTLTDNQTCSLQQQLEQFAGDDLCIKFQAESLQGKSFEKLSTAQATLLLAKNKEQLCAVRASSFVGGIADLDLKLWREPIANGNAVYITHVVNYREVCISAVQTKQYPEIFKHLEQKCQPFGPSMNIPIGIIVLVVCSKRGNYRAEVIDFKDNLYAVHNIDTGSKHRVSIGCLRKSCRFLDNLPVSQCRGQIKTICNIPPVAVPPNTVALQLLMMHFTKKTELQVEFDNGERSTFDLLDISAEPHSLMTRMLPLIFTAAAVELQPAKSTHVGATLPITAPEPNNASLGAIPKTQRLPPLSSSPKSGKLPPLPPSLSGSSIEEDKSDKQLERYYFDDLQKYPIELGERTEIFLLNVSGLHKTGYITACFIDSEKTARCFQKLVDLVAEYGTDDNIPTGYVPDVGEMCLTLFSEDNTWSRGVCLEIRGQKARILYCDFGNMEDVPFDRIKRIPNSLLHAVYATQCYIDGFDKSKNFLPLEEYLTGKNKICCTVLPGPEPNARSIKIPLLSMILSNQLSSKKTKPYVI